jgi:hypothetical protein
MKHMAWLTVLCLLIAMTGCGSVVYRVNPGFPPKMTVAEAKDAVELSLSLADKDYTIESFVVREDYVDIKRPNLTTATSSAEKARLESKIFYDSVEPEIRKIGDKYTTTFMMSSAWTPQYETLSWKSEEDAKQFVNATYVLRKQKEESYKQSIQTSEAQTKTIPSGLPTDDKVEKEPIKKDIPGQSTKKDVAVKAEEKLPKQTSTLKSADKTPPIISITSHNVESSTPIAVNKSSVTIAGKVTDDSGVADVFINDQQVDIDEKGNFSADLLIKVGKNPIIIKAMDIKKNETTKQFFITRESKGKDITIAAKKTSMPKSSVSMVESKSAPRVIITSPDVTRAVLVVAKKTTLTIIGIAESEAGIMDVQINGRQADIDEKGNFSSEVPLRIGQNKIEVTAIDVHNNRSTKRFVIGRESGKIATAKTEPVVTPVTGLRSAKYYALFIAVQEYNNPDINKLDYPLTDAKHLMETLVSNYTFEKENVVFLQNPDRKSIYKSFQELRKHLTEKDNLLVFYAGHGMWMNDMNQGFWLPKDAAGPNDPSDWIPNSSIRDYIKSFRAKHVLLVSDSCFSGGIFKVRDAFAKSKAPLEKIYEMPSRKAITSGSLKTVPDRSVFVEYIVKRLKDNREPYLDTQKLFASIREAVINNSATSQTPLYGAINEAGDEGGDFVFVRRH